jgi:hypothetical protein
VRKNSEAGTEEDRSRLELVGQYHLGGFVNRFERGCLVMRMPDSELAQVGWGWGWGWGWGAGPLLPLPLPPPPLFVETSCGRRQAAGGSACGMPVPCALAH